MYQDKKLTCKDCGQEFVFTVNEQNFYAEKGFTNEPTRCKACRDAKKNSSGGRSSARKEMFAATCAKCGKSTQVPFKPSGDRPVYCSDCFSKQR
ncbi:MAG: zinc-binding protein [Clostridiales bacterium GWF2_38_85]|nr:MAG: zinc-binding protein [Clostridiales bacterium GWF2_38_85]HBL84536.1 zinc-binding protein [Clostridiales bacterium]